MRQFTRLLRAADDPRASPEHEHEHPGQTLLETAQAGRGMGALPHRPDDDDLVDPIGRPRSAFERMAEQVATEVATISRSLIPAR